MSPRELSPVKADPAVLKSKYVHAAHAEKRRPFENQRPMAQYDNSEDDEIS